MAGRCHIEVIIFGILSFLCELRRLDSVERGPPSAEGCAYMRVCTQQHASMQLQAATVVHFADRTNASWTAPGERTEWSHLGNGFHKLKQPGPTDEQTKGPGAAAGVAPGIAFTSAQSDIVAARAVAAKD